MVSLLFEVALWILFTLLALQDHAAVAVCGGNYAGSLSGNLSTPNFPQNYPDSSNCIWIINCPYQHEVLVSIPRLNIEEDKTCAFDYLLFFDGPSSAAEELPAKGSVASLMQNKVCGERYRMNWQSTGRSITVKFKSDDSTSDKGFSGTWKCVPSAVVTTTMKRITRYPTAIASTTQAHPRPTSNSQSLFHSTSKNAYTGASRKSTPRSHSISTVHPPVTIEGSTQIKINGKTPFRTTRKSASIPATSSTRPTLGQPKCSQQLYKKITWQPTEAGSISIQPCPARSSGLASRKCLVDAKNLPQWSSFVDTSQCVSLWIKQIDNQINDAQAASITSINELATKSNRDLLGGDIIRITQQLKVLTEKALKIDLKNPSMRQSQSLNKGFMEIGSNILGSNAWTELEEKNKIKTASDLMQNLENAALAIIRTQSESQSEALNSMDAISTNIVSSSKVILSNTTGSVSLLSDDLKSNATLKNKEWNLLGQVEIPRKTIKDVADGDSKCFSACIIAKNVGKLLSPSLSNTKKSQLDSKTNVVNTFVTSLALSPKPKRKFPEPVSITSNLLKKVDLKKFKSKCSYLETNSSSPVWSQSGVATISVTAEKIVCQTNHFTNFAVLMQPVGGEFGAQHSFVLMIITQIGIGVSLLCLILALSIFINCKSLKSVRNTIHKNLCVSLALAYVMFVVGISRTENKIVCTVFATLLYYFLLVAFLWMLMEGVQLYILLVQIFPRGDGFKKHYYAICWGFPAVLSVVLCGSHPHGFGNASFCWLSAKDHFIWAFVVPVLIIISINSVFFIMTFKTILRNSSIIAREQEMSRTIDKIRYWAKGSVGLVPLLGITWLFGVLYINNDAVVMAYLFTFCNAFQGMYIFIFYCIMNEKVREDFRRRFCAISRSSSHSFSAASKKSIRGSAGISLTAINFPWNQRRGVQTVKDVIVVHDPTVVRNGTGSSGTTANIDGTFSKRYQDIIREDTGSDGSAAARSNNGTIKNNVECRSSIHSSDSRDSGSDLISPEITHLVGDSYERDIDSSHESIGKGHMSARGEEDEQLAPCIEEEEEEEDDDEDHESTCRDEADEFEERIMRAIERNIRRNLSEEDVAIDVYDDQTVYV